MHKQAKQKFEVQISGYHSTPEEWKRAFGAKSEELPDLTERERDIANKFDVSPEEYKRGKLAGKYGRKRLEERARGLGEQVQLILGGLGPNYQLRAVLWEGSRLRWLLRTQTPEKVVGIPVSVELADDVLDSHILEETERLKSVVLSGVGRDELLTKQASR
jgi:hypothetical protein